MTASLTLADAASLDDLGRYARRAKALDEDAALRLQAGGSVLAAWVGVLPGSGLFGEGLVLGLRTFALAEPADLDVAVPAAAVTDRTAHALGRSVLLLPPVHLTPAWASLTPPRSGWEYAGAAAGDDLAEVARAGMSEIGSAVKERGAAAGFTKTQVWGAMVSYSRPAAESLGGDGDGDGDHDDHGGDGDHDGDGAAAAGTGSGTEHGVDLPAGVALAAYALGFLSPGRPVQVYRTNRWSRVSGPGGHVLTR